MKIILLLAILLTACDVAEINQTKEKYVCDDTTKAERTKFILTCIAAANPMSDEEPEDWIRECNDVAIKNICPKVTFLILRRRDGHLGAWYTVSEEALK